MDAAVTSDEQGTPTPPRGWLRPVGAFVLDLVVAAALMLAIAFLGFVAWGAVEGVSMALSGRDVADLPADAFMPGPVAMALIGIGATGIAALLTYLWRGRATAAERARSRQAMRAPATWNLALLTGIGVFVFSAAVAWVGRLLGVEPEPTNLALMEAIADRPALILLLVVVLAPGYEELLFRRVLFGRLWRAGQPWLGLVLSSLVFALVHEMPGLSANHWPALTMLLVVYGGMGAAFAWVYWRTGTLWAPIIAHATNNLVAAGLLLFGPG